MDVASASCGDGTTVNRAPGGISTRSGMPACRVQSNANGLNPLRSIGPHLGKRIGSETNWSSRSCRKNPALAPPTHSLARTSVMASCKPVRNLTSPANATHPALMSLSSRKDFCCPRGNRTERLTRPADGYVFKEPGRRLDSHFRKVSGKDLHAHSDHQSRRANHKQRPCLERDCERQCVSCTSRFDRGADYVRSCGQWVSWKPMARRWPECPSASADEGRRAHAPMPAVRLPGPPLDQVILR